MSHAAWEAKQKVNAAQHENAKFDDLPTLESVAQEWIDRLEQFGQIYPLAKPRALLLKGARARGDAFPACGHREGSGQARLPRRRRLGRPLAAAALACARREGNTA